MMDKKKFGLVLLLIILSFFIAFSEVGVKRVYADSLSDSIEESLGNLDLSGLEDFFNNSSDISKVDFFSYIKGLLKGEYGLTYETVGEYLLKSLTARVRELLPTLISIIAIAILCSISQSSKGGPLSENVSEITFFVCISSVILLIISEFLYAWQIVKIAIENIVKLCEIMSPIIITLMTSIGASVSVGVYKPIVAFFSTGVANIVLSIIMPLIALYGVFNTISCLNFSIKFNKFAEFVLGTIKWILGLVIAIFGLFLTVQGLTSAHFDGISLKAAKYTISSAVPIIGGFLKDGFDIVIAGSVLIKNAVGVSVVVALLFTILSPTLYLAIFSLGLKLVAGIIEPISDIRITNFCFSMAKTVSYLTVALLTVGFMLFIFVILMTLSANAFI